jgi:hypothetical protein
VSLAEADTTKALTSLDIDWVLNDQGVMVPMREGVQFTWAPLPGSQEIFLQCMIEEVLIEGNRGPGKTDVALMDFAQDVGVGWGSDWVGVLFRKTYPELQDVIQKSRRWFKEMFPGAKYNEANSTWVFPQGERLLFRQFAKPSDYWKFHGHAYPWICWEELCTYADDQCFKSMFSCSRSTRMGMPRKIRATTNPYGVGHNWVKARYRLPVPQGQLVGHLIMDSVDFSGELEPPRIAIHSHLSENKLMLRADPTYISRLRAAARNPAELAAWVDGSWDIVAGGMFDDVWARVRDHAVVRPFKIPDNWKLSRSLDWGSSKPSSVGFWAEANGEDYIDADGVRRSTVPGDLFRVAEIYTWNGKPNEGTRKLPTELAKMIVELEVKRGWRTEATSRVRPGAADAAIFNPDEIDGSTSIADEMARRVRLADGKSYKGPTFKPADKARGTRKLGWQAVRERLDAVLPKEGEKVRELPGLFVWDTCSQWIRTVPSLPRDEDDMDDVDTDAEDHTGDETRYKVREEARVSGGRKAKGV